MPTIPTHLLDINTGNEQVYNAMDCCITYEIFEKLSAQLNQAQPAYNFELALQAPVLEMSLRGFPVNMIAREKGIENAKTQLTHLNHIIQSLSQAIMDRDVNINSSQQLKLLFYTHLNIPEIKVFTKGELKTPMDRDVIEQITNYYQARPIANAVLAYREIEKQIQLLSTEVDKDWRMRTSYNIGGTKIGRFSSSKSVTGSGGNLQNVNPELRYIFEPDPGYVLCGIDAEQSDSRMVGYMCGVLFDDWTYLNACESGDLHSYVTRLVWPNLNWTGDLKKDRKIADEIFYRHFSRRDLCKRLGHGSNFLGKPPNLAKQTHIPRPLVKSFQDLYFTAFSSIQQWQRWTATELQTKQQLTSIYGRKRDFFDRTDKDETLRQALSFLAASATADNLNLGMWRIWRYMPEVQLLAQVHDAVYFQFKETLNKDEVITKAQALLKVELTAPNGRKFSVPTEVKLGYNWGNKSEKNPNGLTKPEYFSYKKAA